MPQNSNSTGQSLSAYVLVLAAIAILAIFIYFILFGSSLQQQAAIGLAFLYLAVWAISKLLPSLAARTGRDSPGSTRAGPKEPKK